MNRRSFINSSIGLCILPKLPKTNKIIEDDNKFAIIGGKYLVNRRGDLYLPNVWGWILLGNILIPRDGIAMLEFNIKFRAQIVIIKNTKCLNDMRLSVARAIRHYKTKEGIEYLTV